MFCAIDEKGKIYNYYIIGKNITTILFHTLITVKTFFKLKVYTEQFTPREQHRGCRVPECPEGKCKINVSYEWLKYLMNRAKICKLYIIKISW